MCNPVVFSPLLLLAWRVVWRMVQPTVRVARHVSSLISANSLSFSHTIAELQITVYSLCYSGSAIHAAIITIQFNTILLSFFEWSKYWNKVQINILQENENILLIYNFALLIISLVNRQQLKWPHLNTHVMFHVIDSSVENSYNKIELYVLYIFPRLKFEGKIFIMRIYKKADGFNRRVN